MQIGYLFDPKKELGCLFEYGSFKVIGPLVNDDDDGNMLDDFLRSIDTLLYMTHEEVAEALETFVVNAIHRECPGCHRDAWMTDRHRTDDDLRDRCCSAACVTRAHEEALDAAADRDAKESDYNRSR